MSYFRSHNCGELSVKDIDKIASLSGWINKKRDHGGVRFIDLRDHFGITQCVVNSDNKMFSALASKNINIHVIYFEHTGHWLSFISLILSRFRVSPSYKNKFPAVD